MPINALYVTTLVSVTGDVMAAIAIPWFVLQTTGSAAQMGIAAFFSISPIVLGMVFGGALVDRVGYKRVSVLADLASGVTMMLIPLLHGTVGLEFWQLLALVFLGNLMDAPGRSARQAMLPELAKAAGISIERATGLTQALNRGASMLGAPLAGVLIGVIGATSVLWIDAATFLFSSIGVLLLIPTALVAVGDEDAERTSYLEDLRAGFRFVRSDSLIRTFIVVVMLTNMIDAAMSGVTLPVYAEQQYGSAQSLGWILSVFGGAAVAGTLLYSWRGENLSRRWTFTVAFIVVALRLFLFMLFPPLWALLIIVALTGVAVGPLNPIISVVMYERVPDQMRARVFGFMSAGVLVAMPFGALVAGFLLEWVGLWWSLLLYGVIYLATTVSLIFLPSAPQMDAVPEGQAN